MHIEILIEDSSGQKLLNILLPALLGPEHSWRVIAYKGVGRLPRDLAKQSDPVKRVLLNKLPQLLRGYGRTPGIDAVVVIVDTDRRDCANVLQELHAVAETLNPRPHVLFRLAIEEMEAWYLGDRDAVLIAYPKAKMSVLTHYVQDSVCETWELLADALVRGGAKAIKRSGFPASGTLKHEWAERIGPNMDIHRNVSPSFIKLRDGLRRLTAPEFDV